MLDDIALVRHCKKGNRDAFDTIIKKYYLPLNKFFYKHTHDPKVCEDLTHDVVIKLLENINRYNPIRGVKFSTWLFKIAYHTYIDYIRKLSGKKEVALDETFGLPDKAVTSEELILTQVECEELNQKLHTLPQEMRTLLILRYMNGFGYSEIGKITGIQESKVKSRLHYSLKKLKSLYALEGGRT